MKTLHERLAQAEVHLAAMEARQAPKRIIRAAKMRVKNLHREIQRA